MPMIETRLGHRAAPKILMFRRLKCKPPTRLQAPRLVLHARAPQRPRCRDMPLEMHSGRHRADRPAKVDGVRHDAMPKATAAVVVFRDSH